MNNPNLLNEAVALHLGVMRWVDSFTIGKNEGGVYIRLFHSRAGFAIATVYHNDFKKIPPWMAELATKEGEKMEAQEETVTKREVAVKKKMLRECPRMIILRYQFNPGADLEQWRFHGIHWIEASEARNINPEPPKKEVQVTVQVPPDIKTKGDAWAWAVKERAFDDVPSAELAFKGLEKRTGFQGRQLLVEWVQEVNKTKDRRRAKGVTV